MSESRCTPLYYCGCMILHGTFKVHSREIGLEVRLLLSKLIEPNRKVKILLFKKEGFHLHPTKSVITPTQRLTFLGFVLDSNDMTVTAT